MRKTAGDEKITRPNQSSEKLLTILELLSAQEEPVRLQEIARLSGMNASTVFRFVSTLQRRGYAAQDEATGRYYLTYKICALAANVSSRKGLRDICIPFLRSISHIFRESANLAEEHDLSVVYIEVVPGPQTMLMTTQRIGNVAPMHCTGVGKLLLLNYTEQQLDYLIAAKGMTGFTDRTLTTKEALAAELEQVRQQGYAFDDEECEEGARCVAAPVRDYTGKVIAGLSVSGPATRMTDGHIHENLPFLLEAAQQVSFRLGYQSEGGARFQQKTESPEKGFVGGCL